MTLQACGCRTVLSQGTFLAVPTAEFAAAAAGSGFEGVSLWRHAPAFGTVDTARRAMTDAGLCAHALCTGRFLVAAGSESGFEEHCRALDDAARLGAGQLVIVVGPARPSGAGALSASATIARARTLIERLVPVAAQAGVVLALEPFHPVFAAERSALVRLVDALDLVDQVDSPWLGLALDSYHVWWDPELDALLPRAARRTVAAHLADWLVPTVDVLRGRGVPGEGVIDLDGFVHALRDAGYTGPLEVEVLTDRFEAGPVTDAARLLRTSLNSFLDPARLASGVLGRPVSSPAPLR